MTRINRRIRARVSPLSEHERFLLLYGPPLALMMIDGPAFSSRKAEERAWRRHRDELLAENLGPGRRPYAYFKFDLGCEPRRWRDQIECLIAHGQITAAEAAEIDRETGSKFNVRSRV